MYTQTLDLSVSNQKESPQQGPPILSDDVTVPECKRIGIYAKRASVGNINNNATV
jgi:hypothetical protein